MKKKYLLKIIVTTLAITQTATLTPLVAEGIEEEIVEQHDVIEETVEEEIIENSESIEHYDDEEIIENDVLEEVIEDVEIELVEEETVEVLTDELATRAIHTGVLNDVTWSFDDVTGVLDLSEGTIIRSAVRDTLAMQIGIDSSLIKVINLNGVIKISNSGPAASNLSLFFSDLPNLTAINGLELMDVSNISFFTEMFLNTPNVEVLNVSWVDTSQMSYAYGMFDSSGVREIIGLEQWNTQKLRSLEQTFKDTVNLTTINVNWDTPDLMFLKATFAGTGASEIIGIENWDATNFYETRWMFASVENIDEIHLPWGNLERLTDAYGMFMDSGFKYITGLDTWTFPQLENAMAMFANTYDLEEIEIKGFEHPNKVEEYVQMFEDSGIRQVHNLEKWDLTNVVITSWMFNRTPRLEKVNVDWGSTFKNVQLADVMFNESSVSEVIGIENWDVSSLEKVSFMFADTPNLSFIDLTWPHGKSIIYNYQAMFKNSGVSSVVGMKDWDIQMMASFHSMFEGSNIQHVELPSKFDYEHLGNASMFADTPYLDEIIINDATAGMAPLVKGSSIMQISDDKYTGRWISDHAVPLVFDNANDFMNNGAIVAGTYSREFHEYSVTYDAGSGIGPVPAPKHDWHRDSIVDVDMSVTPTKVGHKFIGWRASDTGYLYTEDGYAIIMPGKDVTFTAEYEIEQYPVKIHIGNAVIDLGNKDYGSTIGAPAQPSRVGHTFAGWYSDEAYTTVWDFVTDRITKETTIYAKFDINQYDVVLIVDGKEQVVTVDYGATLSDVDKPVKLGRTFAGWFHDEALTQAWDDSVDTITADTKLYAKFDINSYDISFSVDGVVVTVESVTYGSLLDPIAQPTKDGYVFKGWYKDATYTTPWDFERDVIDADVTLYAKWEKESDPVIDDKTDPTKPTEDKEDGKDKENDKGKDTVDDSKQTTVKTGIHDETLLYGSLIIVGLLALNILLFKKKRSK